jgi:hypothetical protein
MIVKAAVGQTLLPHVISTYPNSSEQSEQERTGGSEQVGANRDTHSWMPEVVVQIDGESVCPLGRLRSVPQWGQGD